MTTSTAAYLPENYIETNTRKLDNLFTNKKIYRNKRLTLDRLAQRLRTNRSYLSATINCHYRKNFPTFINEYRIAEACEILQNPRNLEIYSMEGIALEVGFANRMSFYRAFRRITGMSVREWVEKG